MVWGFAINQTWLGMPFTFKLRHLQHVIHYIQHYFMIGSFNSNELEIKNVCFSLKDLQYCKNQAYDWRVGYYALLMLFL